MEGEHHHYVPIYAIAKGGTWQRVYFMPKEDYLLRCSTTKPLSPPLSVDKNTSDNDEFTSFHPHRERERLVGKALKNHNEYRQKSRKKDAFTKVSVHKVPAIRRFHIILTSLEALSDARSKIDEIIRSLARKLKNKAIFAIWVAAPQARGVEHFHLYVYIPGQGELLQDDKEVVIDYISQRWEKYVDQFAPVQIAVTSPVTELDSQKVESYIVNQATEAEDKNDLPHNKKKKKIQEKSKKAKMFGVVNRNAYNDCIEIEEYVLPDYNIAYSIRRILRNDIAADVRSWSAPKRFKTKRFQIEGRFHRTEKVAIQALQHVMTNRYGTSTPNPDILPPKLK